MKITGLIERSLSIMIICVITTQMHAQSDNRIVVRFANLQSYQQEETLQDYRGLKDPKAGFSCSLQLERDINKTFFFSTGLFYEIRKNAFVYEHDTANIIYLDDFWYKFTDNSTYRFIGIPVELGVNYLKHPKFSIYQTFGIRLTYLLSAKSVGYRYSVKGIIEDVNYDFSDSRTSVIFGISSSIVIRQRIYKKISAEISPGLNYMVNKCTEDSRFFDIKMQGGIVFDL